jgi:gentisate 1,2-dioxygenase
MLAPCDTYIMIRTLLTSTIMISILHINQNAVRLTSASSQKEAYVSTQLGTLEDLPQDYRDSMAKTGVAPLWPMMRDVLPHDIPQPVTRSHLWPFRALRPLLLRAGELTPVEKAERRVLVLSDPGRGVGAMQATSSIYVGLQLLLPGESAPAHRHTPSAARIVVEGEGAYTVVDGEKLPMNAGDLILTPGGAWHDHGHGGTKPVIWLDALDLPLFVYLEGSYAEEAELQKPRNRPDASEVEYRSAGLLPSRRRDKSLPPAYPMLRYPWDRTEAALRRLATHGGREAVELDYVNPETGQSCLPTLGFTAMMLRPGETVRPPLRSSSAVFHVVEGRGASQINGQRVEWTAKDTFSAPVFAAIEHEAGDEPAFLVRIHDAPLQEKLGFYEERAR